MQNPGNLESFFRGTPSLRIRNKGALALLRSIVKPGSTRIKESDKGEICQDISMMLNSGIPLYHAMSVLIQQRQDSGAKMLLMKLRDSIGNGESLSRAFSKHPNVFDRLFVLTAEVGEESGQLVKVLQHLSSHIEKLSNLKRKFQQAIAYPALVLTVAGGAVLFMLMFIVPTFADLFKSFQLELPLSTLVVLAVSSFLSSYGLYSLVVGGILLALGWKSLRTRELGDSLYEVTIRLPYIGKLVTKHQIARFCRTLGVLLESRVSLVSALDISKRIARHKAIQSEIEAISRVVRRGGAITDQVHKSDLFPPIVAQMIAIGEETSELDKMLLAVSEYYEREIDHMVETLSTVIEPLLILVLSVIVAGILAAMYMPMFDLVNVVGGP